jgi:hypothetical protein
MREELRKPVYGWLYYGTKAVCISLGGLACLLSLFVVLMVGWTFLSSLFQEESRGTQGIGFFSGLLLSEVAFLILIACLSFPLLRRFKEVSPDQAFKMAIILGFAIWSFSNPIFNLLAQNPSYLALKEDSPFEPLLELFPLVSPLILGWLTYRVAYPALSIIGMRLQACDSKPDDPSGSGEALQKAGGMQDA